MAAEAGPDAGTITLNGTPHALDGGCTVYALLQALRTRGRVAVEVNGCIVPQGRHQHHALKAGDRVEIVQAIGGG